MRINHMPFSKVDKPKIATCYLKNGTVYFFLKVKTIAVVPWTKYAKFACIIWSL